MGSFAVCSNDYNTGLWCAPAIMGEMSEDLPTSHSDGEGSNSSVDIAVDVGSSVNSKACKCRWMGCGRWFGHLDLLASHVTRVHASSGQGGLFYCGWEGCSRGDRGFNARYKMLVHVRTHTNEKPHHCFKCDKSFSRAENLKIHARSHTGERPYVCPVPGCGKAYSNSSDRFKHTRTHSVDKPYTCKVPGCPKRYTDPSSLRKHVKTYRHFPTDLPVSRVSDCEESAEVDVGVKTYRHFQSELPTSEESMEVDMGVKSQESCVRDCCSGAQYQMFRSWLSLWSQPPPPSEEQDLPLDLTVHRSVART